MKTLNVVAAMIIKDNRVLATKRGYGEFINMWEFPGGKIEEGESKNHALIREIREELDCRIEITKFALNIEYQYPTFYLKMTCYEAVIREGTPKLLEHNDARWLSRDELDDVNWIPADIKAVDYLKETLGDYVGDELENVKKRMDIALAREMELQEKLEKVGDGPQADSIKMQLEKLDELIKFLQQERIRLVRQG